MIRKKDWMIKRQKETIASQRADIEEMQKSLNDVSTTFWAILIFFILFGETIYTSFYEYNRLPVEDQ